MTLWLRFVTGAVRAWTRLYTWRVAPSLREARRAEIESDLWEHLHADGALPPFHSRSPDASSWESPTTCAGGLNT